MDREQAKELVVKTFEGPFNENKFINFISNLLKRYDREKVLKPRIGIQGITERFLDFISSWERIGRYEDADKKIIDILIIKLKRGTSLYRARLAQRNFVASYLQGKLGTTSEKDAALVAFVGSDENDWRFSFVKMEYRFEKTPSGKVKVKEEFTPAKRWSFLVGPYEKSHTAQSRFVPILEDDNWRPNLSDLERAFDVEVVTKEFFEEYRDLFISTKLELDKIVINNKKVKEEFETKRINTVDFAKKLLGQIVFLYFLQKKGWFGVPKGESWGKGPKDFIRRLFNKEFGGYKNFYNDILEPLFYEALRTDRSEVDHYYSRFDCKIPFLNGGLFDPINNYDWVNTEITIPDELFSNSKGDGILDIFDLYNFTVNEEEPLEKEVALDPELLGKIYEKLNAIREDNFDEYRKVLKSDKKGEETKFNKEYGVYYTPREIVHYMCQESLINYLSTELMNGNSRENGNPVVSEDEIETLIKYGAQVGEHEATVEAKGRETGTYSYKLPESIRKNAKLIDEKLANIKVCDPAVGSGAFPVGMMTEIVKTRNTLSSYIKESNRYSYNFKRDCIQNSLYGVDIDPGAVEIAKLRLWLSLIVDEDDIKKIKPLPNLDYKIMQGNSLLEEYEGIKLIDEQFFKEYEDNNKALKEWIEEQNKLQKEYIDLHSTDQLTPIKKAEINKKLKELDKQIRNYSSRTVDSNKNFELFGMSEAQKKAHELLSLQHQFFNATSKNEKDTLRKEIEKLTWDLIKETLKEQNKTDKIKEIVQFQNTNKKPFFLWKLHFAEVFNEKGGFDIVIANPPYIQLQKDHGKLANLYQNKGFETFDRMGDIYTLFYERGVQLLKDNGHLCFISSNKWMRAGYGQSLRSFFSKHNPLLLVDLGPGVFENATVDTNILLLQKASNQKQLQAVTLTEKLKNNGLEQYVEQHKLNIPTPVNGAWFIGSSAEQRLKEKIERIGKPLKEWDVKIYFGIKTGFNEAFIIDTETRNRILANCRDKEERKRTEEIIKPVLRGRDIKRYYYQWAGLWVIATFPTLNLNIDDYPAIKKHLLSFGKERLEQSGKKGARKKTGNKWFETQDNIAYYPEFEREKVVWQRVAQSPKFVLIPPGYYCEATTHFITTNEDISFVRKYLLAVFNSDIFKFAFYKFYMGGGIEGEIKGEFIGRFPIPPITPQNQPIVKQIEDLVDKIISAKRGRLPSADASLQESNNLQVDTSDWEREIDQLVYKLYDLTEEEIKIVEGNSNDK